MLVHIPPEEFVKPPTSSAGEELHDNGELKNVTFNRFVALCLSHQT